MNKIDFKRRQRALDSDIQHADLTRKRLKRHHAGLHGDQHPDAPPGYHEWLVKERSQVAIDLATNRALSLKLEEEKRKLQAIYEAGFDYERPNRPTLNRLLPAPPAGTKEVTRETITRSTASRHWPLAALLAVVSYGYVFWLANVLPVALVMGMIAFFVSPPAAAISTSLIISKAIAYLVMAGALVFLTRFPLDLDDPARSERIAHHILGAEHWNWLQRLWSCMLYGVSSPWILLAPLVVVPIRLTISLVLLWVYLHKHDTQYDAPQSIVAAARFYGAYQRVMQYIGAAVFVLIAILLIVM